MFTVKWIDKLIRWINSWKGPSQAEFDRCLKQIDALMSTSVSFARQLEELRAQLQDESNTLLSTLAHLANNDQTPETAKMINKSIEAVTSYFSSSIEEIRNHVKELQEERTVEMKALNKIQTDYNLLEARIKEDQIQRDKFISSIQDMFLKLKESETKLRHKATNGDSNVSKADLVYSACLSGFLARAGVLGSPSHEQAQHMLKIVDEWAQTIGDSHGIT
jgi:chromosome segregation ATPase